VSARRAPAETGEPERPVTVELSKAQVERVLRDASETNSISMLLSGLSDGPEAMEIARKYIEDPRLSRSLLYGLLLLALFPDDGSYMGNAEAARLLDIGPSTAHRYISTLVVMGLLEREPASRQYRRAHAG
jgi:hypothetical protein